MAAIVATAVEGMARAPPAERFLMTAAAASGATLPAVNRPLSPDVSVFIDDNYTLRDPPSTPFVCPPTFAIAGDLQSDNGTFFIPAPRLSVDGVTCSAAGSSTGMRGLFGDALLDEAERAGVNLTDLLAVDPKLAVAGVIDEPMTCGAVALASTSFLFIVRWGVPELALVDRVDPPNGCTLAVPEKVARVLVLGTSLASAEQVVLTATPPRGRPAQTWGRIRV